MNHVASVIHHDDEISQEKLLELKAITQQLARNVPIQYIYQKAHFFGLDLYVDQRVLIPRQETEELVDWIISTHWGKENLHILDIGTGSGAIAIALKKHLPKAKVVAMDISEGALEVARTNAKRNRAVIEFVQQDILQVEDLGVCFDLIVSNPPYVREQEKREMHPNVLEQEPSLALFVPDDNPLLFYDKIADIATRNLTSGGKLFFEINQYLGEEMLQMLKGKGFQYLLKKDLNENDRMIMSQLADLSIS
jgi:protein-(glutamine-N5) methyltransferase, release factor-specific